MNNKNDILKRLGQSIEGYGDVIFRPDHPFLIRPPDILLRRGNNLAVIFVPSRNEIRDHHRLFARLCTSRLVMPNKVVHVLITDPSYPSMFLLGCGSHFDCHVDSNNAQKIAEFMETFERDESCSVTNDMRRRAFTLSHAITEITKRHFSNDLSSESLQEPQNTFEELEKTLGLEVPPPIYENGMDLLYWDRRRLREKNSVAFSWEDFPSRKYRVWEAVHKHMGEAVKYVYQLQYGVPTHLDSRRIFLITNHIPICMYDRELPVRSMGLLGICLLPSDRSGVWDEASRDLSRLLQE
jgi:hypothetical protein